MTPSLLERFKHLGSTIRVRVDATVLQGERCATAVLSKKPLDRRCCIGTIDDPRVRQLMRLIYPTILVDSWVKV